MQFFINIIIALVITAIVTAAVTFALSLKFETTDNDEELPADTDLPENTVLTPAEGELIAMEQIPDETFASGVLGKGAAILPEEGKVYAPADGEITALFPTLHAIGMKTEEGAELLIHIGLDTVQLNGEGFEAHIQNGDRVEKGQLLISFDKELIEGKGYCLETPVLITNSDDYLEVAEIASGRILPGEGLLKALK